MRLIVAALAAAAFAGCATPQPVKTYGPDGREAYSIDCSGNGSSWGECQESAGRICGAKGYDTVSSNGDSGVVLTSTRKQTFATSVTKRSLVVSCKP